LADTAAFCGSKAPQVGSRRSDDLIIDSCSYGEPVRWRIDTVGRVCDGSAVPSDSRTFWGACGRLGVRPSRLDTGHAGRRARLAAAGWPLMLSLTAAIGLTACGGSSTKSSTSRAAQTAAVPTQPLAQATAPGSTSTTTGTASAPARKKAHHRPEKAHHAA